MKKCKALILPLLATLSVVVFRCVFLYAKNVLEAPLRDILPGFFLAVCMALLIFFLVWLILRDLPKTGVFSAIFTLLMLHIYSPTQVIRRTWAGYQPIYLLLLILALSAWLLVVLRRKKTLDARPFCKITVLVFTALTLVSLALSAEDILKRVRYTGKEAPSQELQSLTFASQERPNVYFFLFDEYAGFENLKYYYDFDNAQFADYLKASGFTVNRAGRNTDSVFTDTIVPNLLNLEYKVVDTQPAFDKTAYLTDPELFRIFEQNGYQVNLLSHRGFVKTQDDAVNLLATSDDTSTSDYVVRFSILNSFGFGERLLHWVQGRSNESGMHATQRCFNEMEHLTDHLADDRPTFTFAYLCAPHSPILFSKDGTPVKEPYWHDWRNESYYLDYLQYVNDRIETAVDRIIAVDHNAIIILQSDHGSRIAYHFTKYRKDSSYDWRQETAAMQNMLCAVRCGAQLPEIEGMSGINVLRTVLNTCFGTELALLDAPEGYIFKP